MPSSPLLFFLHDDEIAQRIAEDGFVMLRRGFPPDWAPGLLRECLEEEAEGHFAPAKIGGGLERRRAADIRGDRIRWWQRDQLRPTQRAFYGFLEQLQAYLAQNLRLPLASFEVHFAVYPPGTGYHRHIDQIRGRGNRLVSLTFYLNPEWDDAWGGHLRLYLEDARCVDIRPLADTLVLFRSDALPHEVMTTRRHRRVVTCWFRSAQKGGMLFS